MQVEHDCSDNFMIQSGSTLREGMLVRMRYVHHYHGTEFVGLVVGFSLIPACWEVLVGDTIYHLLFRGNTASPPWKLFDGPSLRMSSWIHDVDLVYGVSDAA